MKFLSNKLSVYLALVMLGGGLGFFGSRYNKQPETVDRTSQFYPTVIPSQPTSVTVTEDNENINFIATAVQKVGPAVVRIDASRQISSSLPDNLKHPLLKRFFGKEGEKPVSPVPEKFERGTGSGFIIGSDGRLITNAHVVDGAEKVQVTLKDGTSYEGKVLGTDSFTDVAVIKIDAENLPTANMGDAENLIPGEWAIAIGNPLGLDNTVTVGIVSATGRTSGQVGIPDSRAEFIQTDAAINPGNSGGPLLNAKGEVIGMNTAIIRGAQGLGFAIPIDAVQRISAQLVANGKVDHPFIGIQMVDLTAEVRDSINTDPDAGFTVEADMGVFIANVVPDSPAARAGLRAGDVVSKINGETITNGREVQRAVEANGLDRDLRVDFDRSGNSRTVSIQPAPLPTRS